MTATVEDAWLADLLAPVGGGGGGAKSGDGNNNKGNKGNKHGAMIPTTYEGHVLQPVAPDYGEKKTWGKCSRSTMPFDSAKLFAMGTKEQTRQKKTIDQMFRALSATQQRLVDRIIEAKNNSELTTSDAIWEPFSIRKVEKEHQKNFFRSELITTSIELIIRRKDKHRDSVNDKPLGATTNPNAYVGDVIDLSRPVKDDNWVVINNKPAKKDDKPKSDQGHLPPPPPPVNPDPHRFKWNGRGWEEKTEEERIQDRQVRNAELFHQELDDARRAKHVAQALANEDEQKRIQLRQRAEHLAAEQLRTHNMIRQEAGLPPLAQMPGAGLPQMPPVGVQMPPQGTHPFQPQGVNMQQFEPMPNGMFDPRVRRPRSRSATRRVHTPSISSSEAEEFIEDWSPPPSPEFEAAGWANGSLLRDRQPQRYSREMRTPFRDERERARFYEQRERRVGRRRGSDFDAWERRGGPDDFPPQRLLTNVAQNQEDAQWRPRRGILREPVYENLRARRSDEQLRQRARNYYPL